MKNHSTFKTIIIVIALATPGLLQAQDERRINYDSDYDSDRDHGVFGPQQGDWELTLGGSGSNDKNFDVGSGSIDGSIGYFLTDGLELSLRQGVIFADAGDGADFWNGTSRGALDYHFNLDRVRPFIGANFGGFYGDTITDTWAAGLEAGLKFYVKHQTFIFAMGEYQWLFKDSESADNNFEDGRFLYSMGIGFNF